MSGRGLRDAAAVVLPSHRRWQRLLRSSTLTITEAVAAGSPGPADVIVCGCPRSGTSLVAAALHQPPHAVTVMEPWDAMRLPPAVAFRSIRDELAGGSLGRGRLDLAALASAGDVRWHRDGEHRYDVALDDDGVVALKWPTMWQLLDGLPEARFVVCVREPTEVVASALDTGGRLAQGLEYDIAFNRQLNADLEALSPDPVVRLVELYDRAAEAVHRNAGRPQVHVVRYERWFSDVDALVAELEGFVGVPLTRRPTIRPSREHHRPDLRAVVARRSRAARLLGYDIRGTR